MKVGYVRVSDHEQTLRLQVDALADAGCDAIFGDHGVSGRAVQRKGLDEVLAALQSGDTLVVWKLDRLGRSTIHLLLLLDDLRRRGVEFVAVTQGFDTTTAIGRMVLGQLALFAEFERDQICERTRAGMAAAKRRGIHVGRPRKLSDRQAIEALSRIRNRDEPLPHVAKSYDVSVSTLRRAIMREDLFV